MRGKWTLGPWRARIDRNGRHEVLGAGLHQVAAVFHTPDGLGAANADLIAAAPALYAQVAKDRATMQATRMRLREHGLSTCELDEAIAQSDAALSLAHTEPSQGEK